MTTQRLLFAAIDAWYAWRTRRCDRRSQELAALCAITRRADYEHQMYLRGDPRGTYGQYPPYAAELWRPEPTVRN